MRELTPDTITDAVLGQVATTPNLHLKQQGLLPVGADN
jgi:hypothetical protein